MGWREQLRPGAGVTEAQCGGFYALCPVLRRVGGMSDDLDPPLPDALASLPPYKARDVGRQQRSPAWRPLQRKSHLKLRPLHAGAAVGAAHQRRLSELAVVAAERRGVAAGEALRLRTAATHAHRGLARTNGKQSENGREATRPRTTRENVKSVRARSTPVARGHANSVARALSAVWLSLI